MSATVSAQAYADNILASMEQPFGQSVFTWRILIASLSHLHTIYICLVGIFQTAQLKQRVSSEPLLRHIECLPEPHRPTPCPSVLCQQLTAVLADNPPVAVVGVLSHPFPLQARVLG